MTYKKLFNITYNAKEFTIFIDEKNRKTFLELTKEGNYIYPELNDFIYLHNLYNNSDITKISSLPKLSFKEKVRYQALTLSVIALLNLTSCYQKSTVKIEDNNLIISEENLDTSKYLASNSNLDTSNSDKINIITDLKAFDELLGITSIDYETVKELITTSELPSKFQNSALSILNLINNNAENPELRIFYLLMK